ncbi:MULTISPECIES: hypothetical protein [unclassified Pedobacter]|uniref:hypothetical protein n=1 Tax=unclassified Pedobacter TaxID=2628915 RepID=UPI002247CBDF|nr:MULTISPECIES: hypothetical protein [unclassified Pedobacter]MCX2586081.1 hypothetical protein [Pedobacter sp. MR22-3]
MSDQINPYALMEKVLSDRDLKVEEKLKLIDELRKNNPVTTDRWAPRVAIWILGLTVITTVICVTVIILNEEKSNEGLIAIGSAAVGGLAGLISQSPRKTAES